MRQFLANESSLKMIKNTFYFTSKALFVLMIINYLSWPFGWLENKVNFKISDVTYRPMSREAKAIRQWNLVS